MEKKKVGIMPTETWVGEKKVNGIRVPICGGRYVSCNILGVEVGTTGFCGGDSGHGSRTYLSFTNDISALEKQIGKYASTDMRVVIDGEMHTPKSVELLFGGDCELTTLIQSLEFALKTLKEQANVKTEINSKEHRQALFFEYLGDLLHLYAMTGKLSGMSKIQEKYNVTALTQAQFFMLGLHQAVNDDNFYLTEDFANAVYEYVLDKSKTTPMPNYKLFR